MYPACMNDDTPKKKKRPRDLNQLAAQIVGEAVGDIESSETGDNSNGKNPAAVALGRLGGKKGGRARAEKLTPAQRKEIAQKAAQTRWENKIMSETLPEPPFAKYRGELLLGDKSVDCYVLDTGERVISLRATVKAIANADSGNLGNFIGATALKPFINNRLILGEVLEFSIPGTQFKGSGIKSSHFEEILRGYVEALHKNALSTERQRQIAIQCAVLSTALTKVGLDALIDEATGYQYERAEDALQLKLRLYIAEELRAWEKTFPDELWEQFGRLTHWTGPLHLRPKWWGKLVIELIYDTLDPDVADYLKKNRPPANIRWHQGLTEEYGIGQLVSRCFEIIGIAKTCSSITELRERISHYYKRVPLQLTFTMPTINSN
jgi:P63C domain.